MAGIVTGGTAVEPLPVATVGSGSPGVGLNAGWVEADSSVWADAVYSPFNVANVSGVAEFDGRLHANCTMAMKARKRMRGDLFISMIFSPENDVPKIKDA